MSQNTIALDFAFLDQFETEFQLETVRTSVDIAIAALETGALDFQAEAPLVTFTSAR